MTINEMQVELSWDNSGEVEDFCESVQNEDVEDLWVTAQKMLNGGQ